MEKFFQIFHDLHFDISFADALLLMPKFASTIKSLLTNKDKFFELAKVPLNENCSTMLLKKPPEKLRDPGNGCPKGVAEDVFVKVGKLYFPTDFVVVDFKADPRVPLILWRSFLRTGRALIDVYGEEITLGVNDESVTFNLNQTMRYSLTYDDNSVNRVDVIDIACEEFVQDVDFCKEPIVKSSSPTLTPFGESDFFLKEIKYFLNDESILTEIENSFYDPEGDILYLEKLQIDDPFQLPPMDLKQAEETKAKSSIEEPPELELKELPSHLEYAFLKDTDKLPVIIAKGLKDVEKEALIKVLKSHTRAIAWKISDNKGIDPRFCTHKILMEEDYKPAVQSQRRVNMKIHDVIKKEVIKLLDAEMIYSISNSPWVSPIHCVPKKGGMTVVANDNNELIPTRLVENEFYCFLDGFLGYFQILIDPKDKEKTTFTCPYGTFAYRRMPFGLCNAPGTFQRDSFLRAYPVGNKMLQGIPTANYEDPTARAFCHFIEFGDSYKAPPEETGKGPASESSTKKKGRTVVITTKDMQKRRNDVKAILKTFGGNEATKKTKKNQLKKQYGNFKAEGSETLEQTFNRLQAIVSHLEFIDVEIEQDDLNQKFLRSLAPEWLIVKGEVHTSSVPTASLQVSTATTDVAAASLSHDTVCAYIASQLNGSQIKYEDITQINEDDIEEMDLKWNMALLSMRANKFWKKTECRAPRSQDIGKRESYKQGPKEEEPAPKALMAIDGIGWD
nr:reverse transcriptase domain-containing protein [Tanacetum cinerariifolium]